MLKNIISDVKTMSFWDKLFGPAYSLDDLKIAYNTVDDVPKYLTMVNELKQCKYGKSLTKTELEELQIRFNSTETELKALSTMYKASEVKLRRATDEMKTLKADHKSFIAKLRKLHKDEISKVSKECADKLLKLDKKKDASNLLAKNAELGKELATSRSTVLKLTREIEKLKKVPKLKLVPKKPKVAKEQSVEQPKEEPVVKTKGKKLDCKTIKICRQAVEDGVTISTLSRKYKVAGTTIRRAIDCKTYKECCEK